MQLKVFVLFAELKCLNLFKMPIYQAFNPKIKAWVKYEFGKGGWKPIDVKQKEPLIPFKHTKIKGNRR